jgi:hypothetical protein
MSTSVAIVTGASQGIGRSTAIRLARDFSSIVLAARDRPNLCAVRSGRRKLARSSILDVPIVGSLVFAGAGEGAARASTVAGILAVAIAPALAMDLVISLLFAHFRIAKRPTSLGGLYGK